jgi:hypothetical protein
MSLEADRRHGRDGMLEIVLSGPIDDQCDLESVFVDLPEAFVIDLERVSRMNSIGIKRWLPILARVTENHRTFIEAVPYAVVIQANVTKDFFGKAELRSCQAPYYCQHCRKSQTVTVRKDEVEDGGAPTKSCPGCRQPMAFDELDGYFALFQA